LKSELKGKEAHLKQWVFLLVLGMTIPVQIDIGLENLLSLLEGDPIKTLKSLPENVRSRFASFLGHGFVYCGLDIAPTFSFGPASGAGDNGFVGRFIWRRDYIAAALLASQSDAAFSRERVIHSQLSVSCVLN